jgi:hypothetical protein
MLTESPKLLTVDDRLARIEDMLIRVSMRLDKVEHHFSVVRASLPASTERPGQKGP